MRDWSYIDRCTRYAWSIARQLPTPIEGEEFYAAMMYRVMVDARSRGV